MGPALGHVGRSLLIARAVRKLAQATRIIFTRPAVETGERHIRLEFESDELPSESRRDELFADALETAISEVRPELICLDLSAVRWLNFVRLPDVPMAYVTNFFLTSLVDTATDQASFLNDNRAVWNAVRDRRDMPDFADTKDLCEREAVLLSDPPGLLPPNIALSDRHRVVGPLCLAARRSTSARTDSRSTAVACLLRVHWSSRTRLQKDQYTSALARLRRMRLDHRRTDAPDRRP